ncbi:MAG: hypothetical protein HY864_13195 [Chloroflexi bacterium]|nr:hypothetical protein [Chloroflexota bacterium]
MKRKQQLSLAIAGLIFLTACNLATATPTPQADLSSPTVPTQTPPEPATATQTLTPAPTFTPTPYPRNFTEEFSSNLNAWELFQTGGSNSPTVKTENSMFRIDIASPHTWYYAIQTTHEYSSVAISAKVDGSPSGSIGLVCFYNESNGWYEFNIASDKTFSVLLGQWLAEGVAQYTPLITDTTGALESGNLNYEIGLVCRKESLLLYINGNPFGEVDVSKYGLAAGKIGITASSFDELPTTAFFDWVKVSEK